MKVKIRGDLYDEEIIAFVRKLNKKTKDFKLLDDGGTIPGGKEYVVQLKHGYSLDARGQARSIFLTKDEGEGVIRQLEVVRGADPPQGT
jgi:hypothetical protein